MKKLILFVFLVFLSSTALASKFETNENIEIIAKRLQSKLPNLAIDGLIEAKRENSNWKYSFWIEVEKASVTEVKIELEYVSLYKTGVIVSVTKIEGGLIFKTNKIESERTSIWSEKINSILTKNE